MSEEDVIFNLELNVEKANSGIRRLEFMVVRVFGLWGRLCRILGLPEDSPIVIVSRNIQHLTMLARQMHTATILLSTAMTAVPGLGQIAALAMAGLSIGAVGLTATDFMMDAGA
jgi:hypothetical protein